MAAAEGDDVRVANTTINCRILYVGKEERGSQHLGCFWVAMDPMGRVHSSLFGMPTSPFICPVPTLLSLQLTCCTIPNHSHGRPLHHTRPHATGRKKTFDLDCSGSGACMTPCCTARMSRRGCRRTRNVAGRRWSSCSPSWAFPCSKPAAPTSVRGWSGTSPRIEQLTIAHCAANP